MAPAGEEALQLEARRRIYEHVRANPGSYEREIQRALGLGSGNLDYHLDYLEKRGLLTSQLEAHYKRYFVVAQVKPEAKPVLALLRQRMPRRVLVWLLEHPRSAHKEVAEGVGAPPSSLAFHLKKLLKARVVEVERAGRESLFWVRDADAVVALLVTYRVSLLDQVVDRFLDTFLEVNHGYLRRVERPIPPPRGEGPRDGAPAQPPASPEEGAEPPEPPPEDPRGARETG